MLSHARSEGAENMRQSYPERVDREDIQGLVASGYNHLDYASYIFLRVDDAGIARRWLGSVAEKVNNARPPGDNKPSSCINIAISFDGIVGLGVPAELIHGFPHEFTAGMNRPGADLV